LDTPGEGIYRAGCADPDSADFRMRQTRSRYQMLDQIANATQSIVWPSRGVGGDAVASQQARVGAGHHRADDVCAANVESHDVLRFIH
jgi:hypothetical protein